MLNKKERQKLISLNKTTVINKLYVYTSLEEYFEYKAIPARAFHAKSNTHMKRQFLPISKSKLALKFVKMKVFALSP